MNKLLVVIQNIAMKMVLSRKDDIIAEMNKKINIPLASEEDEKELLEGIWELLEESIAAAVAKKK